MGTYGRLFEPILREKLARPFVHVLFGGRQTGKSTLVRGLLPEGALIIDFSDPKERRRFSENVGLFVDICNALPAGRESEWVFVDEAQTVPSVFDSIQSLYDRDKTRFRFVLCGSSARRLRSQSANLLPGRSMRYLLHPLVSREYEPVERTQGFSAKASPFSWGNTLSQPPRFPCRSLEDRLVFGDLPGVAVLNSEADKADLFGNLCRGVSGGGDPSGNRCPRVGRFSSVPAVRGLRRGRYCQFFFDFAGDGNFLAHGQVILSAS